MDKRRMCPGCRAFITSDDKVCPYCDHKIGARAIDLRVPDAVLGGLIPGDQFVTMLLLMVNTALYVATVVVSMQAGLFNQQGMGSIMGLGSIDAVTLRQFGANDYIYVSAGQWWRLITAGFLHVSLVHIAFNMYSLFSIGAQVEEIFGGSRMAAIWILSTMTGFGSSYYFSHNFSAGASAGLFGLIGAMIALGVLHKTSAFAQAAKSAYLQTAIINLALGFMGIFPVDNWAHMGGLAGGFLVAMAAGVDKKDGGSRDKLWHWIALLCLLLTAYAFARLVIYHLGT